MNQTHKPGNEPDPGDMSTEPGTTVPDPPSDRGLPDGEAEELGNFA